MSFKDFPDDQLNDDGEPPVECCWCGSLDTEYSHGVSGTQFNGSDVDIDNYHCNHCGQLFSDV